MNLIQIENRAAKIRLNDVVWEGSMDALVAEIESVAEMEDLPETLDINIEINSPGGSVFAGWRGYNAIVALRNKSVRVTATVDSMAASMASVIAMAANRVVMGWGSRMMIHNVWNIAIGDAADFEKNAVELRRMNAEIASVYRARTGLRMSAITKMMDEETWMDADQAIGLGFADAKITLDGKEEVPNIASMSLLKALFGGSVSEDRITEIEARISEADQLRADLQAAQAQIAEIPALQQTIAAKDAEIADLKAQVSDESSIIADLKAQVNAIPQKIAEAFASIGQPEPLPIPPENPEGVTGPQQMKKADFDKLTPQAKSAFCLAGGKITD